MAFARACFIRFEATTLRYTLGTVPEPSPPETYWFSCTRCGDCCRTPGIVELDLEELEALGHFLGQTPAQLLRELPLTWRPADQNFELVAVASCPLLAPDGHCSVEPVKPQQCRSYPFWPEITDTRRAWRAEARRCEGIDHPAGHGYPRDEVVRIGRGQGGT